MAIVNPQRVFKVDGVHPVDRNGLSVFPFGIDWTPEENFYEEDVLTGAAYVSFRTTSRAGVRGPSGLVRHQWSIVGVTDETGWNTLRRINTSSYAHNCTIPIVDTIKLDTDGTTTIYDIYREALGNTYGAVNEIGVNSGIAAAFVDQLSVYNRLTGVTYTIVWNVPPAVATEVRMDSTGAGAFRTLTFHTAPSSGASVIRVEGYFLYNVSFAIKRIDLGQDINAQIEIPYQVRMRELGS